LFRTYFFIGYYFVFNYLLMELDFDVLHNKSFVNNSFPSRVS
jgi:hypothetical protein